ncbi:MAG: glycosyltransferase family 4 protein [Proteobacteria bacterium]|nr:glycosyltransferase family 4 protein [Pseudomonadota bacterium]
MKLKVLWFTSYPAPEMVQRAGQGNEGYGGHWAIELLRHVSERNNIELGVATAYPGLRETSFKEGGVTYFTINQPRRFPAFGMRAIDLEKCAAVIDEFKPDLIHIHGSEFFYGMVKATGRTNVPTVISIQGLLGPYSTARHFFGALSPIEILKSLRLIELPVKLGLVWLYIDIKKGARREKKILSAVEGLLGRTEWDHAHARIYNPDAVYCHVGEIMRPAFYDARWSLDSCDRQTIVYTNAGHPRRGTENLLAAVALLRYEFPNIRLRLAGRVSDRSGYGRFIRRRIKELGIDDRVEFLGYLDDKAMACELLRAHVFAITSYIENSPNSLAEAMLLGLPCVASYVGGIPDMVRTGETGLLYPVDDVPLLAEKIRNIFVDAELAVHLGSNARSVAHERHNPKRVVEQLVAAYNKILTSNA